MRKKVQKRTKIKKKGEKRTMAMSSARTGEVIGLRVREWDDSKTHEHHARFTYLVLSRQRVDKAFGLPTEAQVFEVVEDSQVLGDKLKPNVKVNFYEEEKTFMRDGKRETYKVCSGLELAL